MINTAILLLERGMHVVPWYPNKRAPMVSNFLAAPPSADFFRSLTDVEFDIAIIPQQHAVVDLDRKKGKDGVAALASLGDVPETLTVSTPSGGRHLWFTYTGDLTSVDCGQGIEFKRKTGSVHVPPSAGYAWADRRKPVPLPEWMAELWATSKRSRARVATAQTFQPGERHNSMVAFAAVMRQYGHLTLPELKALLHTVNEVRANGEMPDNEVEEIAQWAAGQDADGIHAAAILGDMCARQLLAYTHG